MGCVRGAIPGHRGPRLRSNERANWKQIIYIEQRNLSAVPFVYRSKTTRGVGG